MVGTDSNEINYDKIEIEYDSEETVDIVFGLVRESKNCNTIALVNLETVLKRLARKVRKDELDMSDVEIFMDLEDDLSWILNDTDFRTFPPGPHVTKCAELLSLVHRYLVPFNENFEVVLALNPFLPEQVVMKLLKSSFSWEEDGTTQALARASSDLKILEKLSKSRENSTRFEVAANPNTPSKILEDLAKDVEISDSLWYCGNGLESFIQVAVVRNPNTSNEVLQGFLTERFYFTEDQFVASHGWSLISKDGLSDLRNMLENEARARLEGSSRL